MQPTVIDQLTDQLQVFLAPSVGRTRLIGLTGSVASGKSTLAETLRARLSEALQESVNVVGTDGFLFADETLRERGLLAEKGFPRSHDDAKIARFCEQLESPAHQISVPIYNHEKMAVDSTVHIELPSVIIVEGVIALSVLARVREVKRCGLYLDADREDLLRWYSERVARLGRSLELGVRVWHAVNLPNLTLHIEAQRARADIVLWKRRDHSLSLSRPQVVR